jgi:hypothetical protein
MAAEPALKGTNIAEKIAEVKIMVKRKYGTRVGPGPGVTSHKLSCVYLSCLHEVQEFSLFLLDTKNRIAKALARLVITSR